jgi:SOS-response transcriptional repressor LexA
MPPKRNGPYKVAATVEARNMQRERVWQMYQAKKSYSKIAEAEKISKSTVQPMIKSMNEKGFTEMSKSTGRPAELKKQYAPHFYTVNSLVPTQVGDQTTETGQKASFLGCAEAGRHHLR